MTALVVYAYTNYAENKKMEISNDWEYFNSDNPTVSEILNFEERHSKYPDICSPRIINIIKLDE